MRRSEANKIRVKFYQTKGGHEPVKAWLKNELDKDDRKIIGEDIKTVQLCFPIGKPLVEPLGDGLFEIRSKVLGNRITRVLFCFHEGTIVLLHGFIKKTQKTPLRELRLARCRQGEVEEETNDYKK